MKFSRGAEEEADKLGVQYMYAAGYDPGAMATMLRNSKPRTRRNRDSSLVPLDAPGPAGPQSYGACLAARFPEHEEYVISSSEFQRVKGRLLRLSNARASTAGAIAAGDDSAHRDVRH